MSIDEHLVRTQLAHLNLTPLEGGWRVRETEHYFIDVLRMSNRRIAIVPKDEPFSYERSWCYRESFVAVVLRCWTFDPDHGEEPTGWIKEPGTERRGCAWYYRSKIKAHEGYDPDCPDCGNESLM